MTYLKPLIEELVLDCDERFAASVNAGQIYFETGTEDNEFNTVK